MRIRPNERQQITDILHEELEEANRRISERLGQYECQPASSKEDSFDDVRRLYNDLVDKNWTEADEESLNGFAELSEEEIKRMMCEAFRRSRVHPIPSFASLINVLKRNDGDPVSELATTLNNPDAIGAMEREHIANILHDELKEAADLIAARLKLDDTKAEILREQLQVIEGTIVSRMTPLV